MKSINWKLIAALALGFYIWYAGPHVVEAVSNRARCNDAMLLLNSEIQGLESLFVPGTTTDQIWLQQARINRAAARSIIACE